MKIKKNPMLVKTGVTILLLTLLLMTLSPGIVDAQGEEDLSSLVVWQDDWHDNDGNAYSYRMPVDISSGIEASWYQVGIILNLDNFDYGHAQSEGEDMRAVIKSEEQFFELPYWIEEWNQEGESILWVKVPRVRGRVRIYLCYGNSEVNSKARGKEVFEFFDDFSSFTEWSVCGNTPITSAVEGRKVIQMTGDSEIVHPIRLSEPNYAFESLSKLTTGMQAYMPFFGFGSSERHGDEDNAYQFGYNVWGGSHVDNIRVFKDRSCKINVNGDTAHSQRTGWARTTFAAYKGYLTQVVTGDSQGTLKIAAMDTDWRANTPKEVGIIVWHGAVYALDWLLVRKHIEPEPTLTLGSEEEGAPKEGVVGPVGIGVLDLSRAGEVWAREWEVVNTVIDFPGGGNAGFHEEAIRSGHANPNPGREGILYLHPKSQQEPARISRRVTVTGPAPILTMGVSGNRDVDGDWVLVVKVNGELLEKKIIDGSEGWQDLAFDLSEFSGQTITIEIEAWANNWYYEYAFFDYIRTDFEEVSGQEFPLTVDIWTSRGGKGAGVEDGGTYRAGEKNIVYLYVSIPCQARWTWRGPSGEDVQESTLEAGTHQVSGVSTKESVGQWEMIFEAWTDEKYASDTISVTIEPRQGPLITFSAEQKRLIDRFSYPDTFTLFMGKDELAEPPEFVRIELWNYHVLAASFRFENGQFKGYDEAIEFEEAVSFPRFRPNQFSEDMTLEDINTLVGDIPQVGAKIVPELMENSEIYEYEQGLITCFQDEKLVFVSTVPVPPRGE